MSIRPVLNFPRSADTDVVTVPSSALYSGIGIDGFTIEANVMFSTLAVRQHIFEVWNSTTGRCFVFYLDGSASELKCLTSTTGSNNATHTFSLPSNLVINTQHHLALVFSEYSPTLIGVNCFVDGVATTPILGGTTTTLSSSPANLIIGGSGYSSGRSFSGKLFDARIWDYNRSQSDLATWMHTELYGNEPGLIGYWKAIEGSGTTLVDHSVTGNDGAIGGSVSWSTADVTWTSSSVADEHSATVTITGPSGTISSSATQVEAAQIVVDADFERSCVDVSQCTVGTDVDDETLITLRVRRQTSSSQGWTDRWLEPVAHVSGVSGQTPRFEIVPYLTSGGVNGYNHQTWGSSQKAHFSYDGVSWAPFATTTRLGDRLTWQHDQPFSQDSVYVARSWPRSVSTVGNQVTALATSHPTKIFPTPAGSQFTPSLSSWPAQNFIVEELAAKTDELGGTVPAVPLYGFCIDDSAYGEKTKKAIFTAGIHSGEDVGELVFWELMDWLLGSSTEAIALRSEFRVLCYPMMNPAGRYAGYWRGAPGSTVDPNREWLTATPTHDCVAKTKPIILSDLDGSRAWFAFDVHASPSGAGIMQLGVLEQHPATVAWDSSLKTRYPSGSWADYFNRTTFNDVSTDTTLRGFLSRDLNPVLPMVLETTDIYGPVSPQVMQPYAEAMGGALYDLLEDGWFDDVSGAFTAPHQYIQAYVSAGTLAGQQSASFIAPSQTVQLAVNAGTLAGAQAGSFLGPAVSVKPSLAAGTLVGNQTGSFLGPAVSVQPSVTAGTLQSLGNGLLTAPDVFVQPSITAGTLAGVSSGTLTAPSLSVTPSVSAGALVGNQGGNFLGPSVFLWPEVSAGVLSGVATSNGIFTAPSLSVQPVVRSGSVGRINAAVKVILAEKRNFIILAERK